MNNPKREINILLLGETGVGKSTFINAFANYLNFSKFKDVEKSEPFCLIPTTFVLTDDLNNIVTVEFSKDTNDSEQILKVQSAKQKYRDYVFKVGDSVIRFINIPGIGDTSGIEKDKTNLENILTAIGDHEYLNAICILLKSTNPRLTAAFEFVITQLLSQLEKSVVNNIIFVYTNARSSNFKPGDTGVPIAELLSKIQNTMGILITHDVRKNVFCLDNETFRFMLALRSNIQFRKRERRGFEDSWEISVEECQRLMEYVFGGTNSLGLKPIDTRNTNSIFVASRMIEALKKSLEEIAKEIQMNIGVLNNNQAELREYTGEIKDLHEKYSIKIIERKIFELAVPNLVCSSEKCRKHVKLLSGATYTHYPQVCGKFCLDNVITNSINNALEETTPVIYARQNSNWNEICKLCKCPYNEHNVENYATEIIERNDDSLNAKMSNIKDLKEIKQAYIDQYDRDITNLESELETIMENTAKFAYFLKDNAIIAYNDSFEKYIKFSIENEETKEANNFRDKQIKRYQKMLEDYWDMKSRYEHLISSGSIKNNITPSNVYGLIEQLYQLPKFGQRIEAMCKIEANAGVKVAKLTEIVHTINDKSNKHFGAKLYSCFLDFFK